MWRTEKDAAYWRSWLNSPDSPPRITFREEDGRKINGVFEFKAQHQQRSASLLESQTVSAVKQNLTFKYRGREIKIRARFMAAYAWCGFSGPSGRRVWGPNKLCSFDALDQHRWLGDRETRCRTLLVLLEVESALQLGLWSSILPPAGSAGKLQQANRYTSLFD